MFRYFLVMSLMTITYAAFAAPLSELSERLMEPRQNATYFTCGDKNTDPTALYWDPKDRGPRQCGPSLARNYTPKFKGLGFEVLNFESEACFVPDQSFQLLDTIVATIVKRVTDANPRHGQAKALLISKITSSLLTEMGFALWIPTENLSDALALRRTESDPFRHIFDCDTGSMILLTVAEALGVEASLVESTIDGHDPNEFVYHNFVRWRLDEDRSLNWDMNFKDICTTPNDKQLPYQGKELSKQQFWGYESELRGNIWQRNGRYTDAAKDFLEGMKKFPERPGAYNGFAWAVASKEFSERENYSDEALAAALKAVAIRQDASYEDTLACVYAFRGDFTNAIETEKRALQHVPVKLKDDFMRRLNKFEAAKDCSGEP